MLASALVEVAERFRRRVDEALDGVDDPRERLLAVADACNPTRPRPSPTRSCGRSSGCGPRATSSSATCTRGLYDDWRAAHRVDRARRHRPRRLPPGRRDEWACQFAALLDGLALHVILHPGALGAAGMASSCRAFVAGTLDADVAQPASETGSPVSAER